MAILKKTKKEAPVKEAKVKAPKAEKAVVKADKVAAAAPVVVKSVLKRPRITEKAGMLAEKGIYTFEVELRSNSQQIAQAIKETYKVTPVKISIARIPSKAMFSRGKAGATVAGKKAYVYLKKGDKIDFA